MVPLIFAGLLILVGACLVLGGLAILVGTMRFRRRAVRLVGKVVGLEEVPGDEEVAYKPRVDFKDATGVRRVVTVEDRLRPAPALGSETTILHCADRPTYARLDSVVLQWVGPFILIFFGVVALGMGALVTQLKFEEPKAAPTGPRRPPTTAAQPTTAQPQ